MRAWEYDPEANAAYLHLSPDRDTPAVRQVQAVRDEILLDLSAEGRLLGVEALRASELLDPRLLEG